MKFTGTVKKIQTSGRGRNMTIALSPGCSLDDLEGYIDMLCGFEVGLEVQGDDAVMVDVVTGEIAE